MTEGKRMYEFCEKIYPICRSITGNGVRETYKYLQEEIAPAKFTMYEVPTGTHVLDWTVPKEWNIRDAYIIDPDGNRLCEFKKHNLNLLHYSVPVDMDVSLEELKEHLYTLKDQPDVVPYASSYYKERWGFCMTRRQFDTLKEGTYHVYIDSSLEEGSLTYGELIFEGESQEEVMFSSYTCHPSMANNECSGPAVMTALIRYVASMKKRRYTYRFVLAPETIGAITYISRNLETLKKNVICAFNLTCVGDDRTYSVVQSRYEDTLADKVLGNVLKYHYPDYDSYSYLERGSDERQYQAPGVDIPMVCFCRSKYHIYPEYHTSADNLDIISPEGLQGSYDVMVKCIEALEYNRKYRITTLGEPQLGKRGLVPTMSTKETYQETLALKNLIVYADGRNDLIDISNIIKQPVSLLTGLVDKLLACDLLEIKE